MYYEAVQLIVSHMDFLEDHLHAVFKRQMGYSRLHYLKRCINYHEHIITLAKKLNSLLSLFCGHMSLVWAICFGCIGYQMLEDKPLAALFYLGGYVMLLSLLVIPGQTLISQSEGLARSMYSSDWYLATVEEQKTIRLMLQMGQVPLTLSATPFGYYQYSLFVTIIKTAYSYMMLLHQSTGQKIN
nr:unnamed protein product [Callosobruchus chinensis]